MDNHGITETWIYRRVSEIPWTEKRLPTNVGNRQREIVRQLKTRGQDYKEKHKLDSKQISSSPC